MSSAGVKIKLVLYAPKGTGAVATLEKIRAGLPAGEVTALEAVDLEGPLAKKFDYNSKLQLKGQTLEWALLACDGQVHSMNARQALLKGAHGILLWAETAADGSALEAALVGDFDQVAGRNYALVVVGTQVPADAEPAAMLKELMKAALKVAAAAM